MLDFNLRMSYLAKDNTFFTNEGKIEPDNSTFIV
jgi:hypothetical protein